MGPLKSQRSNASSSNLRIETSEQFEPLLVKSRYKGIWGGRGSGKSHFYAELAIEECLRRSGTRIVCLREVQKALRESVKLLIEDKIKLFHLGSKFRVLKDSIVTPGGGLILFQGMQDHTAESIKSLEGFDIAYFEEAQSCTRRSLELLRPTIRKEYPDGSLSEIWFSWNPRSETDPVDEFLRGENAPRDSVVVRSNWKTNTFFTKALEAERVLDQENYPLRYGHIWEGEYEPMAVGAIWDMTQINKHRVAIEQLPNMKRVVVSIDPAGSAEQGANETGITVEGLGENDRGYVLDDVSMVGMPQEWARRAIAVYDLHDADALVAEVNFGGDMVKDTIRTLRPNIRVIEVRASRRRGPEGRPKGKTRGYAKSIRAEPIAALYNLGKISHCGAFTKLEAEMCLITAAGYEGQGSPSRVDSMVWGFTELFPKIVRRTRPKDQPVPTRANSMYNPHRLRARR